MNCGFHPGNPGQEPRVGKYVLFFHASFTEAKKVETGHGGASLAFAWSDDLVHWEWAGKKDIEGKKSSKNSGGLPNAGMKQEGLVESRPAKQKARPETAAEIIK